MIQSFDLLNRTWNTFEKKISYQYKIGPFVIRLEFTHLSFAKKIIRAFHHLITDDNQIPDFTIHIWDSHTTHQAMPKLNWDLINRNGYHGHAVDNIYFHYFDNISALSAINLNKNKAYYVVKNSEALPWWVSGSPLQIILHVWLSQKNYQLTHTAAIANDKSAVLLLGKGGSGKSTTTFACVAAGLNYIGEDYCVLAEKTNRVYSIYQSAKWTSQTCDLFHEYKRHIQTNSGAEKKLLYFDNLFPARIAKSATVSATISLQVGQNNMPMLTLCSSETALKNMMLSSLIQLPFFYSHNIMILKNFISNLKTKHYQLILGKNIDENVKLVETLLR